MRTPTPEQQAILSCADRLRVVRAAPGSGKTVMVGMLIRKELEHWHTAATGIAALSFTRVGGYEIQRELGYELGHPHFVGTLDAFLFRFIVRPFLRKVNPDWSPPRLIPAEWSPDQWRKGPGGANWTFRGAGGQDAKTYNLFEVCFVDKDTNGPVVAYRPHSHSGLENIAPKDRSGVLAAKRELWRRDGWLTHSDAAWLASELLHDAARGAAIRAALLRRFPLLIVDELQDTGFFLAQSIRALLQEPNARGVLVGDPNQAIYEFNGARPALFSNFERIPNAIVFPLGCSQRCPARVVAVANHLKETTDAFAANQDSQGHAFLVRYDDMSADLPRIVQSIREAAPSATTKVIVRKTKTVEQLTARAASNAPSLHCPVLSHLLRAVRAFRQGHNVRALEASRAALCLAVLGYEGVSEHSLVDNDLDASQWKALAIDCLLKCNSLPTTGTLFAWQADAGRALDACVSAYGLPHALPFQPGKLKPKKHPGWDRPCTDFLPGGSLPGPLVSGVPVQTIHSVKGETHDITVLVCPPPSPPARCPSSVWWSVSPADLEERRIAYVAMTRTRGDLIVCVDDATFQRLRQLRPEFIRDFQTDNVDQFLSSYSPTVSRALLTASL